MTFSQCAVEAAARAIAATIPLDGSRWNPPHGQDFPNEYMPAEQKLIRAIAIQALTAALAVDGVALVPVNPTSAMIEAGCEHNPTQWNEGTDMGFAADVANDVYRAMLAAASEGEELDPPPHDKP